MAKKEPVPAWSVRTGNVVDVDHIYRDYDPLPTSSVLSNRISTQTTGNGNWAASTHSIG